ncbi:hypothetical protein BGX27_005945 [Mortierella sp. AM989]|nr:hypothetical protein BGX27_005945 [Mortierella sp. AM989]
MASESIIDLTLSPSIDWLLSEESLSSPSYYELNGGESSSITLGDNILREFTGALEDRPRDTTLSSPSDISSETSRLRNDSDRGNIGAEIAEHEDNNLESNPSEKYDVCDLIEEYESSAHSGSQSPSPRRQSRQYLEFNGANEDGKLLGAPVTLSRDKLLSLEPRQQSRQHGRLEANNLDEYEEGFLEEDLNTDEQNSSSIKCSDRSSNIDVMSSKGDVSLVEVTHGIKRKRSLQGHVSNDVNRSRGNTGDQDNSILRKVSKVELAKITDLIKRNQRDNSQARKHSKTTLPDNNESDMTASRSQQARDLGCNKGSEEAGLSYRQTLVEKLSHMTGDCMSNSNEWSQSHDNIKNSDSIVSHNSPDIIQARRNHQSLNMHRLNPPIMHPEINLFALPSPHPHHSVPPPFSTSADIPIYQLLQFAVYEIELLSQHITREQHAHLWTKQQMQGIEEERDELKVQLKDMETHQKRLLRRLTKAEQRSVTLEDSVCDYRGEMRNP